MKKIGALITIIAMFFVVATSGMALASQICANVHIAGTATTSATPSGIAVRFTNTNASACGDLAAGATQKYFLSTDNTDQTLAIVLTAISLGKLVWVSMAGTGAANSLVEVVSMSNPM